MAIYQYHLTVIPRQSLLRHWDIIPVKVQVRDNPGFDEDDLINVKWWNKEQIDFGTIEKRILGFADQVEWTKESAFRHALWNALVSFYISISKCKELTDAHENWTGNPANEKDMDLKNNAAGRGVRTYYSDYTLYDETAYILMAKSRILELMKNGQLYIINSSGHVTPTNTAPVYD